MKRLAPLLALALVGCLNAPPSMRRANATELRAVELLRAQYASDGIETGACEVFDDVYIAENPQRVIEGLCGRNPGSGVIACVYVVNVSVADVPGSVLMHIASGAGWRSHHSLVIHEANHVLNSCAHLSGANQHANPTWRGWAPGMIGTEGRAFDRWDAEHPIPVPDPYAPMTLPDAGAPDAGP